jgi:hypothetical protein
LNQYRVVVLYEVLDGLGQWSSHVGGHELEHLRLPAGAKDEAEPDEENENGTAEGLARQSKLRNAKKDAEGVVGWSVDA